MSCTQLQRGLSAPVSTSPRSRAFVRARAAHVMRVGASLKPAPAAQSTSTGCSRQHQQEDTPVQQQPPPQQQLPAADTLWHTYLTQQLLSPSPAAMLAIGMAVVLLAADATSASAATGGPQYDLSEGEEFWGNVARYGRYFVTVMLGTGYVMLKPLAAAFKRPVTAVFAMAAIAGAVVVTKLTLEAMLGISAPFAYEANSIVPYAGY